MSGALIQLVSKGVQDMYTLSDEGHSFFRQKFMRHTNFSQAPKYIKTINDKDTSITIPVFGDLINALWFEGTMETTNLFQNSTVDLYVGGQKVDSQHSDYFSDIWGNYLADSYSKARELNYRASSANPCFLPMHFFFCDHGAFLPLVALQSHQVEIKINFDFTKFVGVSEANKKINVYANYVFLDKEERESLVKRSSDFVITQVQRHEYPLDVLNGGHNVFDMSCFNHPVKSLFFGFGVTDNDYQNDFFKFTNADIQLNGTPLLETMSPSFFHTIQNYYKSSYGYSDLEAATQKLLYTRYFAYHFCLNASDFKPSGTCNFSRLDNSKLIVRGAEKGNLRAANEYLYIHAVNYNVLRIKDGLGGLLFGN